MGLKIIKSFENKRILLVGDVILDVYVHCNVVGKALYANVPEVEEVDSAVSFGGNGLVAKNILELGGNLTFFSITGGDKDSEFYDAFTHPRLKKFFFVDKRRRSTVKTRWYAGGKALLQVNKVDNDDIDLNLERKIIKSIKPHIINSDVVVIMDPQHGFLTKGLINFLKDESHKHGKPLYVDAQISHRKSNHHLYKGVDTMLLNQNETKAVYPKFNFQRPEQSLRAIMKKFNLKNIVVKLGNKGSVAVFGNQYIESSPFPAKAVDVCGAGDAFLAALSLGDRDRPDESLKVANIWGALSTEIYGTIPPRKKDLINVLKTKERK